MFSEGRRRSHYLFEDNVFEVTKMILGQRNVNVEREGK
jgi:hypothetical protein